MKNKILRIFAELFRQHISIMVLLTIGNTFLYLINEDMSVCFSALLPQKIVSFGLVYYEVFGQTASLAWTIALATISLLLYLLCLFFSYRKPGWLLVAAGMMLSDTALAVYLLINESQSYFVDIIMHAYIILALIAGYVLALVWQRKTRATPEAPVGEPGNDIDSTCE